jgi:hypothetical protein
MYRAARRSDYKRIYEVREIRSPKSEANSNERGGQAHPAALLSGFGAWDF